MAQSEKKKEKNVISKEAMEAIKQILSKGHRVELIPTKNGVVVNRVLRDTLFKPKRENSAPS